ncbi:MAG: TauD/TfdA family dioxygenase [Gammaproteobacteria bacterium]|nr:TauD/TfdA family dioxygenase [Gammaproteobacteria bacterium]
MAVQEGTARSASPQSFEINPLSDLMGAEVVGLDLREPMSAQTKEAVYQSFLKRQVLVFRGQALSKQQQIDFTQQFGTLERHAKQNKGTDSYPLLHVVNNLNAAGEPAELRSSRWHSDKSFRPAPSMATILHAIELPPSGGDTCFANMYAAYEALPASERTMLDDVNVVHSWIDSREHAPTRVFSDEERRDAPPMTHPIARPHPETGRRALFLGTHAAFIEGLAPDEGRALIERLEAHATQDNFIFRHRWQAGDVLMWDNRCLLHRADSNFEVTKHPRVLHRTCLRGTPTSAAGEALLRAQGTL